MMTLQDIIGAVVVDEVGIFTARLGPLLLKTAYQPLFTPAGDRLELAAMSSGMQPLLAGQPIRNAFIEAMSMNERQHGAELGRALAVLNRVNVDAEGLPLILHADGTSRSSFAEMPPLLEQLDRQAQGLDAMPGRLICELPDHADATLDELARFAADCRGKGFEIALGHFAGAAASVEAVRALRPEIVSIDEVWFHAVAAMPQAARLVPSLFESIRKAGCKVHVRGIRDAAGLALAIRAEADYLQGDYLAKPAFAGTFIEATPLRPDRLANSDRKIVPLFG